MKYKIALKKTDEGYSVRCPGLPGCWSQGDTEAEAIDNIKDAIQEYLAASCSEANTSAFAPPTPLLQGLLLTQTIISDLP